MLRWREAERIDFALTDEGWIEPEAAALFAQVLLTLTLTLTTDPDY